MATSSSPPPRPPLSASHSHQVSGREYHLSTWREGEGEEGGRGGCKCCDGCGIGSRHVCNPHATLCIDALQVGAVVTLESVTVCVRVCGTALNPNTSPHARHRSLKPTKMLSSFQSSSMLTL